MTATLVHRMQIRPAARLAVVLQWYLVRESGSSAGRAVQGRGSPMQDSP